MCFLQVNKFNNRLYHTGNTSSFPSNNRGKEKYILKTTTTMSVRASTAKTNRCLPQLWQSMKWLLRQMGSYGHINSIEVAVLCLMQKKMNEQDAWKKTKKNTH